MSRTRFTKTLFAVSLAAIVPIAASADDKQRKQQDTTDVTDKKPSTTTDVTPKRTSAEVMKITNQTIGHINAAVTALEKKDTAAAKKALAKGEQALEPLYDTPALVAVLNEIDEAIASVQNQEKTLKTLDLAPLAASVGTYRAYIDPSVAARIDEAKAGVKQGDAKTTMDALRLARNRMAIDIAFLPVEEAYLRIGAAQHALDQGDTERATQLLRTLPIVVSEVQLSTPLVPVRFKLNAAALAAEEGNWKRSQSLLREATKEMRSVEKLSKGKTISADASTLVDDLEKLDRKMNADPRPQPKEIRELAQRTRDLGA